MNRSKIAIVSASLICAALGFGQTSKPAGGPVPESLYSGLVWRNLGPFRGGRVSAVSGAIGQPDIYYAGMPGGGVWKSTNAGITWDPIFDSVTTACSVGSVQVAPSDSNIVYVGLGDGTTGGGHDEGDGVYKSTDGGKTWAHCGLDFAKQIPSILVDPHDPNVVLAAVLGDFRKANHDRGVYRSTDGGKTWTRTLMTDSVTGAQNLSWAIDNPSVVLATTVRHCMGNVSAADEKADKDAIKGTTVVRSTDGGVTWKQLKNGFPDTMSGRTCAAVAMNSQSKRMFFVSNAGLWRSDDQGDHWQRMDATDPRVRNGQGGYNCGVYINTKDPDTVYVLNTCSYISHDGGKTFTGFKGAPGGDDPQQMWIDPTDGNRMFLGVDQGPAVSLDGGKTWSGWYNIANGQFYHIAVSNSWPYWIYATMQDSGAIGMSSRGKYGEVTPLDWSPNPGWEWGEITVDPLDPNTIYSTGQANDVIKQSSPTGEWVSVSPDNDPKLALRHDGQNQPILFSPANPHELMIGYQYLMSSTDGGRSWRKISPDMGHPEGWVPPAPETKKPAPKKPVRPDTDKEAKHNEEPDQDVNKGDDDDDFDPSDQNISPKDWMEHEQELMAEEGQRPGGGGTITALSPSSLDNGIIWAGTGNGFIKLTEDHGKTWHDVNIPKSTAGIACLDASHTDRASAYAVLTSNSEPLVYRTKDFGKTWTKIVTGLPSDEVTGSWGHVVRADTKRDGLLFLGTESSMYVSFDDGDHWESLRLNAPNTSYRDIAIKDNDLVVGTYGRSFWILDDISPLRQMMPTTPAVKLFAPGDAIRVRRNVNQDTPMPPEVPHSLNAPPGALIYYYLGDKPSGEVSLDVSDSAGHVVRHYSSTQAPPDAPSYQPIPDFWREVPKPLPAEAGLNRINWDLRYEDPPSFSHDYNISATPHLTPLSPQGPLVPPGVYDLKLTVGSQVFHQKVTVKIDPRSPGSARDIMDQHRLQMECYDADLEAMETLDLIKELREQLDGLGNSKLPKDASDAIEALKTKLTAVAGEAGPRRFGRGGGGGGPATLSSVQGQTIAYLGKMEFGDIAPSQPIKDAVNQLNENATRLNKEWSEIKSKDIPALNALLSKDGASQVKLDKK